MNKITLGNGALAGSEIVLGCMRISEMPVKDAEMLIESALNNGIDFFDHADVYRAGKSEEAFARAFHGNREDIILQTKCGTRKGFFDFSKEHIIYSVDESLKRLRTDYIDVLLLHKPDALMEPEEIAEAFEILADQEKVRCFGVCNQTPMQIMLLNKYLKHTLIINQLEFNLTNTSMIDFGLTLNTQNQPLLHRDVGVLDFCRLHNITIQAWSPFQYNHFEGMVLDDEKYPLLNEKIQELAEEKHVSQEAIAVAWILRHPAKMQTVVGTTNFNRLNRICEASQVNLSREEWYQLYTAACNELP